MVVEEQILDPCMSKLYCSPHKTKVMEVMRILHGLSSEEA